MANYTARKVHKQIYPATYNFKDEADGTTGTDIVYVDVVSTAANTSIVSDYQSHNKVLKQTNVGSSDYNDHIFTQATAGAVEFWICPIDATFQTRLAFAEGGTFCILIRIINDKYYYYNGVDYTEIVGDIPTDTVWDRLRVDWYADNTFDVYINGDLLVDGAAMYNNQVSGLDRFRLQTYATTTYLDAWGIGSDPNYSIGDNVHWRHYQDDSDFESEDWGTQGTSIAWVDGVDTAASFEIVPEFNEHKKVLRGYYSSAAGGYDYCYHTLASESTTGWTSFWIKADDAGDANGVQIWLYGSTDANSKVQIRIANDKFQHYTAAAWADSGLAASDATYYFVYIQWYADSTFDVWINNVQYEDGTANGNVIGNGINRIYMVCYDTDGYAYLDAVSCSVDSDVRGDNRTFNYLPYTYDDITTDLFAPVVIEEERNKWRTATLRASGDLTFNALYILQLYDGNGALRFEGNFIKKDSDGLEYVLTFHDLSKTALENQVSRVASAAESIDDTVRALITYVGQAADNSARLQYYTEHDPAGTFVPMFHNRPLMYITRRLGELKDTNFIVKPNGVCFFDNDRSSGYTITEATGEILKVPKVRSIDTQINKVTIYGNVDPDTGTPFSGSAENTTAQADGTGVVEFWRRVIGLSSATDCTTLATAYLNGTLNPYRVYVPLRSVYCIAGETMSFAYSHLSFAATTMYVERVTYNLVEAGAVYTLSEGIIDKTSIEEEQHMEADATTDDILYTLYTTDLVPVSCILFPYNGSSIGAGASGVIGITCTNGQGFMTSFYTDDKCDNGREMVFTTSYIRDDAGADSITGRITITAYPTDGTGATSIEAITAIALDGCAITRCEKYQYTFSVANVLNDHFYYIYLWINEAGKEVTFTNSTIRYYMRRSI